MTLREKIETMEAFERGEEIECATAGYDTSWHYVKTPSWNWKENDYRIKPKPKQIVVIERWLVKSLCGNYFEVTGEKQHFITTGYNEHQVKLLDTYEVEI